MYSNLSNLTESFSLVIYPFAIKRFFIWLFIDTKSMKFILYPFAFIACSISKDSSTLTLFFSVKKFSIINASIFINDSCFTNLFIGFHPSLINYFLIKENAPSLSWKSSINAKRNYEKFCILPFGYFKSICKYKESNLSFLI